MASAPPTIRPEQLAALQQQQHMAQVLAASNQAVVADVVTGGEATYPLPTESQSLAGAIAEVHALADTLRQRIDDFNIP